jgi:transcriptional regulator with XRE-family HTH domain
MGFGAALRLVREGRGLSLRKLAGLGGFGYAYLSRVETGRVLPPESEQMLERLVKALGVDLGSAEALQLLQLAFDERQKLLPGARVSATATARLASNVRPEENAKERFLKYLREKEGVALKVRRNDVVVNERTGSDYDFELESVSADASSKRIALEISRFLEEDEESARTHRQLYWEHLRTALLSEAPAGGLAVRTPWVLTFPKRNAEQFARAMAKTIASRLKENDTADEIEVEGHVVTRMPGHEQIVMSSLSGVQHGNPPHVSRALLVERVKKKDIQLPSDGASHLRVVFVDGRNSAIGVESAAEFLASHALDELQNVDQVYFEDHREIRRVYDRRVRDHLREWKRLSLDDSVKWLFETQLCQRLNDDDESAFELVRDISSSGRHEWVNAASVREALAQYGTRRAKVGRFEEGLWVASWVTNSLGAAAKGQDRARSAACWLLQALAMAAQTTPQINEVLELVAALARDESPEVRQHVAAPLAALVQRRVPWLWRQESIFDDRTAGLVKGLTLRMLRENSGNSSIMNWLGFALRNLHDLTTDEVEECVAVLAQSNDELVAQLAAGLLLDFVSEREQAPRMHLLDTERLRALLTVLATAGSTTLRNELAWVLSRRVQEDRDQSAQLFPYLSALVRGLPTNEIDQNIGVMVAEWLRHGPVPPSKAADVFVENLRRMTPPATHDPFRASLLLSMREVWPLLAHTEQWSQLCEAATLVAKAGAVLEAKSPLLEALATVPQPFHRQSTEVQAAFEANRHQRDAATLVRIRQSLAHFGAPLADVMGAAQYGLEETIVFAIEEGREHGALVRVIPTVIATNAPQIDWGRLKKLARAREVAPELGMMTYLAAEVFGPENLRAQVEDLKATRPEQPRDFPFMHSTAERMVADNRNMWAATAWHLRSNFTMGSVK